MGTPEFPDLGKHCSFNECKQIDFLPFTCDSCHQVFCLEHRSYSQHGCQHANKKDVTVVICPLCAKGVRLISNEDPNITWEAHVNTQCDPSNYEKAKRKRKCPVQGCRELLTFSNTVKCRDCLVDHCLKHRFGPDHKCPGPRKPDAGFQFMSLLSRSRKEDTQPNQVQSTSSSAWTRLVNVASSVRSSAEAGMAKLSNDLQALQTRDGPGQSSSNRGTGPEACPQCSARFSSVTGLVDHVEKAHERNNSRSGVRKVTIDVCPKCSRGFRDPASLVEHVERDHGGSSKC